MKLKPLILKVPLTLLCVLCACTCAWAAKEDTTEVMRLYKAAKDSSMTNPAKSLELIKKGLDIAQQLQYKEGIANGIKNVGLIYMQRGDQKKALQYFNEALGYAEQNKLVKVSGSITNNIGVVYQYSNIYDKAFEYFVRSLKTKEKINDTPGMAIAYANVANCLAAMKRFDEANKYYLRALDMHKKLNNTYEVANTLCNLGGNFMVQHKYSEALPYLYEAKRIRDNSKDSNRITPYLFTNLGACSDMADRLDSALYYYNKALVLSDKMHDDNNKVSLLFNIGVVHQKKENIQIAETYYRQALEKASALNNFQYRGEAYRHLSELYRIKQDYKKAFEYKVAEVEANDSAISIERTNKLAELETRFLTKETEADNKVLQKENALKAMRLKEKDILLYSLLAGALAFIVISILLVRQNKLLKNQQRIELAHKQLYAQMNPHFIFNCLSSIQHFVVQSDVQNANRYLTSFASLMRQTLENSKSTTITLRSEIEYLQDYLSMEHLRFENKFEYTIEHDKNVDIDAIELPPMIVQPFAENAIRHGLGYYKHNEGRMKISFYKDEQHLYCKIDDNGIGREQSEALKEGASIKYRSHGMAVTEDRLKLASKIYNADYSVTVTDKKEDGKATGTTVLIKFPLYI